MKILKTIAIKMIALSTLSILAGYSSLANADNSQNRYRVGGIVSGALFVPDLQNFLPDEARPDRRQGASFTFDWFGGSARQHSLAFDVYNLGRSEAELPGDNPNISRGTNLVSVYLGYRYHTPSGFFVGIGAPLINQIDETLITDNTADDDGSFIRITTNRGRESLEISRTASLTPSGIPLGFNLGYIKTYNNGFSIGFNALQTTSVPLPDGGGSIRDGSFAIGTFGLVFAFTKRDK